MIHLAEKVRLRDAPTRCPYCHDEVEAGREDAVCGTCLARHHADCWGSGCASCRRATRLERAGPAPRSHRFVLAIAATAVTLGLGLSSVLFLAFRDMCRSVDALLCLSFPLVPQAVPEDAELLAPSAGATVDAHVTCRGRIVRQDPSVDYWLVVRSPSGLYWFQDPQLAPQHRDGAWSSNMYIGEPGPHEALVVATPIRARPVIHPYMADGFAGRGWNGLAALPDGSRVVAKASVTRR